MKRRTFVTLLANGTVLAVGGQVFGSAGEKLDRPKDNGQSYSRYFASLNEMLKASGPGRPVMILDLDRMNHNVNVIASAIRSPKKYRVVVKSLPSIDLLDHVMRRAHTNSLMVFHQPFLNTIMDRYKDIDALLGKPMPVAAAREFYRNFHGDHAAPEQNIQWLIDSRQRLEQYHQLARQLGTSIRVNIEMDVGLRRGGLVDTEILGAVLSIIEKDPKHLQFAGFMGYEPHLTGLQADLHHPAVEQVLGTYRNFVSYTRDHHAGLMNGPITLNGAGSHTYRIYDKDNTMNDLSVGSGVVMPTDFDTHHLQDHQPAAFIATPVLKKYEGFRVPGDDPANPNLDPTDPNRALTYFIYGGYWKAKYESPAGIPEPLYHSTNQEIINTSRSVELNVDDYVFLRPTQSEHVMLQFGDLLVVSKGELVDTWPVFA